MVAATRVRGWQYDQLRQEQMHSRATQLLSSTLRRWHEKQLTIGFRTWVSKTFQSKVDRGCCLLPCSSLWRLLQYNQLRVQQMMSRGGQLLMSTMRRWREAQLQRGWRTWVSRTFQSRMDQLRMDAGQRLLVRTLARWQEMQLQRGFRSWRSAVFELKVPLRFSFAVCRFRSGCGVTSFVCFAAGGSAWRPGR